MSGRQVVRSDIVEATVAPLTWAIQIHLDRRETFELEVNVSYLVAVDFVEEAGRNRIFLVTIIVWHLALSSDCSESKGAQGSRKSEEHSQQV